jgi:hypothetical protein
LAFVGAQLAPQPIRFETTLSALALYAAAQKCGPSPVWWSLYRIAGGALARIASSRPLDSTNGGSAIAVDEKKIEHEVDELGAATVARAPRSSSSRQAAQRKARNRRMHFRGRARQAI